MDRALVSGTKGRGFNSRIAHQFLTPYVSFLGQVRVSFMKKWVVPILSLFFVLVLVYLSGPFHVFKVTVPKEDLREKAQTVLTQRAEKDEKKEGTDPYWLQTLIQLEEQLDEWLKSLNERIESKDVSRIEVRFLEILRNILEWVKEKVDAKIDSSRGEGAPKKKGIFQETRNQEATILRG
jgi:hypothetical protein